MTSNTNLTTEEKIEALELCIRELGKMVRSLKTRVSDLECGTVAKD